MEKLLLITQLITTRGCFDPNGIILNTLGTAIDYGLYWVEVNKKTSDANGICIFNTALPMWSI